MMDVKLEKGILIIKRKLLKKETYKIESNKKFDVISIFLKPQILKGYTSYCEDNRHVILIDYDSVPRWLVLQDYKMIQEEYNLPPGYLFKTREKIENGDLIGSYHVVCLQKFYPKQVYEILSKTHADTSFMSMPIRKPHRNWVLRISTKKGKQRPKFIKVIGDMINLDKEISKPHLIFLNKIYKLPKIEFTNIDKNSKCFFQNYEAS
jgi:hypothetical protein